jgi:hypothetical protein
MTFSPACCLRDVDVPSFFAIAQHAQNRLPLNNKRSGNSTQLIFINMSMPLSFENNTDSLLELIPRSQLEPHQIAKTWRDEELPTYKMLKAPKTLEELKQYKNSAIWMQTTPWLEFWRKKSLLVFKNVFNFDLVSLSTSMVIQTMRLLIRLYSLGLC